jgi:hypothetical protein
MSGNIRKLFKKNTTVQIIFGTAGMSDWGGANEQKKRDFGTS